MTNTTDIESTDTETSGAVSPEYREIVSFRLSEQDFCIDIMNIREIRGWTPPTPLPHSPDYVRGLINLRGSVIPVTIAFTYLAIPVGNITSALVVGLVCIGLALWATYRVKETFSTDMDFVEG